MTELKRPCETLEPVRWSRGGLRWKVILVSVLCMYNKCGFLEKSRYFLTYPCNLVLCLAQIGRGLLWRKFHFCFCCDWIYFTAT
jgi:hypothetical protein